MTRNDILNSIAEQLEDARKEAARIGAAEGMAEGLEQGLTETARRMLAMEMPVEVIAKATTLTVEQIEALK